MCVNINQVTLSRRPAPYVRDNHRANGDGVDEEKDVDHVNRSRHFIWWDFSV